MSTFKLLSAAALSALLLTSCNRNDGVASVTADGLTKIRVGYIGITCEAPIFSAVENGYFKEEGLEVELVRCEWSSRKVARVRAGTRRSPWALRNASLDAIPSARRTVAKRTTFSSIGGIERGTSCHNLASPVVAVPRSWVRSAPQPSVTPGDGQASSAKLGCSHPQG